MTCTDQKVRPVVLPSWKKYNKRLHQIFTLQAQSVWRQTISQGLCLDERDRLRGLFLQGKRMLGISAQFSQYANLELDLLRTEISVQALQNPAT
ncbi:hypothetical protein KR51_00033030 [Rubidibacter lacunae KORDI 51-2]|uniref:Uncharacterized protein n=1 Tax=Rubidibacter lacunae KORDI 51-2 TaxID=582515 RepID=U5DFH4_9CHRO|nr:hypothetical protein KR51_00033030 [Rubidibacter lacunae KORDI 51-2]